MKQKDNFLRSVLFLLFIVCYAQDSGAQYCTVSSYTPCYYYNTYINSFVTTGGSTNISNTGSGCNNTSTSYTFFNTMTHTGARGTNVGFTIGNNPSYGLSYALYVDFNSDGDFIDAGEQVYTGSIGASSTATSSFTIPTTAALGTTRMRLMAEYYYSPNSCGPIYYGEIEDYNLNITVPCPVTITTQPHDTSVCTSQNGTFSIVATNTNSYQWQVSTNGGSSWSNISNGSVYSGTTTNTLLITSPTISMNTYKYRCNCTNSGSSCTTSSTQGTLTVNQTPYIASTTPGSACLNGSGQVGATGSTGVTVRWWNQATGGTMLGTGNTYTVSSATSTTNYYAEPYVSSVQQSGSISTSTANNGQVAATFDCKPLTNMTVTGFDFTPRTTTSYTASIYYRTGSMVGNTSSSSGWTLLGTSSSFNATANVVTAIPLTLSLNLTANQTYAFYVYVTGGTLGYTNGSGTPGTTLFASNSDMQIFEGYGSPGLFSSSLYTTRTFAGTIYYTKSVTPPCTNTNRTAVLLTVNTPPQISSHPSNSTICSGSSTSFSSSGTGVGTLTYQWEASFNSGVNWSIINNGGFYSGATTSTLTVSNVTAVLDNYQYRCIVSGTCSPPATSNAATLTVNTPPTITTQPVNADGCPASTVTFTCAATGGGINYQWQEFVTSWNNITNGGMYSGATSATLTLTGITPSMDGQQYRCLITGACTPPDTTDEPTLTVNPLPTISGSSNSPVCEGNDLMLSSISTTSGVTYGWTGPGAYNSTLQNPTLSGPTTANSGNYMVTATITATGCTATASVPVVIKTTPVISSISSNAPVCSGYDINLTSASNAGTTYSWTGPLGFTSTTQNPVRSKVNLQMGGYYKLETTLNGCVSNPDSVNVTIVPSPSIGAYPTPGNKICDGDTIWFYAFASNTGTGPTYQWVKNGQDIPGENALQYTGTGLMNGDIIKLRMSPGSGISCPADILTQEMHIVAKPVLAPVVNVVMDPATPVWEGLLVTFTATPADAGKNPHYQWKRNGKDINGATSDVWSTTSLNDKDVIECEIISDYECAQPSSSMSNQVTVPVLTSVPNTAGNTNLSLFPNPNNGSFTLKGNVNKGKVQLEVLNALGQVIYKNEFSSADGNLQQDIRPGNMADGIYMLRITSGTEQANIRFRVAN